MYVTHLDVWHPITELIGTRKGSAHVTKCEKHGSQQGAVNDKGIAEQSGIVVSRIPCCVTSIFLQSALQQHNLAFIENAVHCASVGGGIQAAEVKQGQGRFKIIAFQSALS